jgi:hypothetical protein
MQCSLVKKVKYRLVFSIKRRVADLAARSGLIVSNNRFSKTAIASPKPPEASGFIIGYSLLNIGHSSSIINRKCLHVFIQLHMRRFPEWCICTAEMKNAGDLEIAVVFAVVAPADQVPAECIEDEADRFYHALADFLFIVAVFDLDDRFGSDHVLEQRHVFEIQHELRMHLHADAVVQHIEFFLLRGAEHRFYFIECGRIMCLNRAVGKTPDQ